MYCFGDGDGELLCLDLVIGLGLLDGLIIGTVVVRNGLGLRNFDTHDKASFLL